MRIVLFIAGLALIVPAAYNFIKSAIHEYRTDFYFRDCINFMAKSLSVAAGIILIVMAIS